MTRAAILIGVNRTGGLPALNDAARSARRMATWARSQDFVFVEAFADDQGASIEIRHLRKAIKEIIDLGTIEQLIIYFSGHGVNIGFNEYWLLTDAPGDPQAAVNVTGCAQQARYCGVSHVVFISDACRTAAVGGPAQRVTGSEIFPNDGAGGLEQPVDLFYACLLGRPALEVRDPTIAASEFMALYTNTLLEAMEGKFQEALDRTTENGASTGLLRPRRLKQLLSVEVPRRIASLNLQTKAVQIPDAHIASDQTAWLARLKESSTLKQPVGISFEAIPRLPETLVPPPSMTQVSTSMLRGLRSSDLKEVASNLDQASLSVQGAADFVDTVLKTAALFGASKHQSQCGFRVRGAKFISAFSLQAAPELLGCPGNSVRINSFVKRTPGSSVLLEFDSGTGVVLPAIPGFLAALTMQDGELVDVSYEPSENSSRWEYFLPRADEIRALRAIASSSTRSGVFRLEAEDAFDLARKMQFSKSVDPALAVYAAYAYIDIGRRGLIKEMSGYMLDDLGARLFDVALLAGELKNRKVGKDPAILSFFPMLLQGWALLGAERVQLPKSLQKLQQTLTPSVWTVFDADGVAMIRNAMRKREVL